MQYISFKELMKDFTVFSLSDIHTIDPNFRRRALNEWQEKGYIKKVINKHYIFSDLELNENSLFEIANRIYSPSYISLEMGLSYYNLIPESVFTFTSVTTRKTNTFQTSTGRFTYRSFKPRHFFGFEIVSYNGRSFKIATPEKCLLDYFYFNPHLNTSGAIAGLRINRDQFREIVDVDKLKSNLTRFKHKALSRRIKKLLEVINA